MDKKDQQASQDKPEKVLTKEFLIEEILRLQKVERSLGRHLRLMENDALLASDNIDILHDLQQYKDIKDRFEEILKISDEDNATTSTQVLAKHSIPPKNSGNTTDNENMDNLNALHENNDTKDKTEMLNISGEDNVTTSAQEHVKHDIPPENGGNNTDNTDVDNN